MRYAWATDIHLDFLNNRPREIISFIDRIKNLGVDGLFLTGDISVASMLPGHLGMIEAGLDTPVNFVLGNHDFYGSSIEEVRKNMSQISNMSTHLRYMSSTPYTSVTPATAVVGHDGWYDGLHGNWKADKFRMSDWHLIKEFAENGGGEQRVNLGVHDMPAIINKAQELAKEGVQHVHDGIKAAVRYHKNIIVLTHVPPWAEAHIHEGRKADDYAMPFFTSKMMGDMLLSASRAFPNVQFTVLSGHTHGRYDGKIADNVMCHVGGAKYNYPAVANVIDIV